MPDSVDVIVIGSGHNGLVAAAYLARAGMSVTVLEQNSVAGGAVASEELTKPGYIHDTFSAWHPLFKLSAAYAELGEELHARGLRYCETPELTTANVRPGGETVLAHRDPARTAELLDARDRAAYLAEIESFNATIPTLGQLLGSELHSPSAALLAAKLGRSLGIGGSLRFTAELLASARSFMKRRFAGREVCDLYSPWSLHTGLSPDAPGSGFQVLAIAGALHAVGLPVVAGGSSNFVGALVRLIEDRGGQVRTGVEVERIAVRHGTAVGVIAGGERLYARRAVIANTTPTQLYGRLLEPAAAPARAREEALRFRFSPRGGMQIHVALTEPLRWRQPELQNVPIVHLSDGLESVALACAQAAAGLLPATPTVVVGQPTVPDPSRCPQGAGVLWIQLQQVPFQPTGDAAGELHPVDGWSAELQRGFVERVLGLLEPHVENWPAACGATCALSPPALAQRNRNLEQGDIYAGDCELGQSYLWRPLPSFGSHRTPVRRLYQCGASTFPGPGLNAASGRIVALQVIAAQRPLARAAGCARAAARRALTFRVSS
jgi:phytoene dehydrogenase-like protein